MKTRRKPLISINDEIIKFLHIKRRPTTIGEIAMAVNKTLDDTEQALAEMEEREIVRSLTSLEKSATGVHSLTELYTLEGLEQLKKIA